MEEEANLVDGMQTVDIRDKAEEAFNNYARQLILDRYFPDYRDGLTPVQRRIVYGMYDMGLVYKNGKPAKQLKSARVIGEVMGKYHPHGDCLHEDTRVYLASGETPTIKELYDETQKDPTKRYEAYSIDDDGKLVRSEISHVRIGQHTDSIYEVTLSNGHVIRTTSNHPFLTYDNRWVKAEDLQSGIRLTSVSLVHTLAIDGEDEEFQVETVNIVETEKEPMYDFTVEDYENALFVASEDGNQLISLHNSGIYTAMANMSKDWVFIHPMVELIGNIGSSDGDAPAAARYTNTRLSEFSDYLTKGINKKGLIDWKLTYEDTQYEPEYLPARIPNLLVSGSVGNIAIGFVVDILPHNLVEVLDVAIQDIKGEELNPIAPDFATGGVIVNGNELEEMYNTGIGRAVLRGRYKIETAGRRRKDKRSIVFYDLPYGVQQSKVVDKIQDMIDSIGTNSKQQLVGAVKVQDESGQDGLRIVVNVEDDADIEVVTELIYKYTQMERTQRYEFLTLYEGQPTRMSVKRYIEEFNKFRKETIIREKQSDNRGIEVQVMRLDALIKLDGIRDEVIDCIRESENRTHARENLVEQFEFTEEQADYLLSLQLARLTKDNYNKYRKDREDLIELFNYNEELINNPELINQYMIEEYEKIKEEDGVERRTEVQSEVREVDLTIEKVIPLEDTVIGVTTDGYIKRATPRSYGATQSVDFEVLGLEATTHDEVLVFTDLGQVGVFNVNEIPEMRWGDKGEHLVTFANNYHIDESVIGVGLRDKIGNILVYTNDNRVKKLLPSEFGFKTTKRFYDIIPVERENGEKVLGIAEVEEDTTLVLTATNKRGTIDYGLAFKAGEVNPTGRSAKGRKLASMSKSKVEGSMYLSGELGEEDYRDVGRAPVKDVFPVDIDLEKLEESSFISQSMKITNEPEEEELEDSKGIEEELETEDSLAIEDEQEESEE